MAEFPFDATRRETSALCVVRMTVGGRGTRNRRQFLAYLCGEAAIAYGAFERALFGVAAIVDLERRLACERFQANVACGVAADTCKYSRMKWCSGSDGGWIYVCVLTGEAHRTEGRHRQDRMEFAFEKLLERRQRRGRLKMRGGFGSAVH